MKRKLLILILSCCLFGWPGYAQEKAPVRFGKVSAEDFKRTIYSIDSNANAVIIADVGSTEMVGNTKGNFSLEFHHYKRVHILNQNGYDIGNVAIDIYANGDAEEELLNLKAVTYNLENGKIIETKLDTKSGVFKDRIDKHRVIKKFTFPNIKEGSIIEFQYTLKSDFVFNLQPWKFQDDYPRLWSEYTVSMPEFYYYVTLSQGYQSFYIKDQKRRTGNFSVSDASSTGAGGRDNFTASITDYRWVMKNVPALKEESFTSTIDNHVAKIQFQLAELRPPFPPTNIMGTWAETCEQLLKGEDFGYSLGRDNPWLNDIMGEAIHGATDDLQKAKNIYAYVRDNMTCTNYNSTTIDQPLRNVLRNRNGNEAEINLLLAAMFRKVGLNAEPVMLSTRQHGYAYSKYPLLDRFNYVVAQTIIDGRTYYMDASEPRLGFGRLHYKCYNGHARIINYEATALELTADSLLEKKFTSVFITNDEQGNFSGTLQQSPGYFESLNLRNMVKEKGYEQLVSDIKKTFNNDVAINNFIIDSLNKYDDPVSLRYNFEIKQDTDDIIYINPMFGEAYKENPFKSAARFYPVEMPYTMDEIYMLQMEIPSGYVVDELPKQMVIKLNKNEDGAFEYRITESNNTISLRSRLRINRSFFQPEEYETLREFFNLVVNKHNEQIVFKKKK